MNKSGNQNKKTRRGSPSTGRDTSSATPNTDAVIALKSLLSVPVQVEKDVNSSTAADAILALKSVLAVPSKPPTPDRPKQEAVQALKSLLLSPVQVEQDPQSDPVSFQALKTMLMSAKKGQVVSDGKELAEDQKRSFSPKSKTSKSSDPAAKVASKMTPPRSEKKKRQKPLSNGKSPFAGSLFQSSPDPLVMPLPDFDETQSIFFADTFEEQQHSPIVVSPTDQLNSLRMMLKIPA